MERLLGLLAILLLAAWPLEAFAQECDDDFVYREAFPGDYVCVTPDTRRQAAEDNAAAATRYASGAADTCKPEYVWRDAFENDRTCVHWLARETALDENRLAPMRRTPGSVLVANGSAHVCKNDFVWRLASPTDFVCAPPEARQRVAQENAEAQEHTGSMTCKSGFVWREALPNDYVCVSIETKRQTEIDNLEAEKGTHHRPTLCRRYARQAVVQFNEMTVLGCQVSGDRWQPYEENHFSWCVSRTRRNREHEQSARSRELKSCEENMHYFASNAPEACRYEAVIANKACLNADGTDSSLAPGESTGTACASTKERAIIFARLSFAQQWCITADEAPDPGCCTVTETVSPPP